MRDPDLPPPWSNWTVTTGTQVDIRLVDGTIISGTVCADPTDPARFRVGADTAVPVADVPVPSVEMLDMPGGPSLWLAARTDDGTPMVSRVDADDTGLNSHDVWTGVGDIARLRAVLGGLLNHAGDLNHEKLADVTRARVQRENDRRARQEADQRRESGQRRFRITGQADGPATFGEASPE